MKRHKLSLACAGIACAVHQHRTQLAFKAEYYENFNESRDPYKSTLPQRSRERCDALGAFAGILLAFSKPQIEFRVMQSPAHESASGTLATTCCARSRALISSPCSRSEALTAEVTRRSLLVRLAVAGAALQPWSALAYANMVKQEVMAGTNKVALAGVYSKIPTTLRFCGPDGGPGPYPFLSLQVQINRIEEDGTKVKTPLNLAFVLDTGADTNTINSNIAKEFGLKPAKVAERANSLLLEGFQFEPTQDAEKANPFLSVDVFPLPFAAPAGIGLLGVPFLNAWKGGVDIVWGFDREGPPPSVTFYDNKDDLDKERTRKNLTSRAPITILTGTDLPSVMLRVNGLELPALLDTGSPFTIINVPAASLAGLEPINPEIDEKPKTLKVEKLKKSTLPQFGEVLSIFKKEEKNQTKVNEAKAAARAAAEARRDLVVVGGGQGGQLQLLRSRQAAKLSIGDAEFPDAKVYIGDLAIWFGSNLPDLAPAARFGCGAVLGLDVLLNRNMMVYRSNELYF